MMKGLEKLDLFQKEKNLFFYYIPSKKEGTWAKMTFSFPFDGYC